MSFLQAGKENQCMELLQRALDLTEACLGEEGDESRGKLRAVTYNNLGCYFRKLGRTREALINLEKALRLLENINDAAHAGDTHLNICAVLSQTGRHSEALDHAQTALILLQEELYLFGLEGSTDEDRSKRFGVLSIAYHNVAVEQEYLGRVEDCLMSYSKAAELSFSQLGPKHPISQSLQASLKNAKETWNKAPFEDVSDTVSMRVPIESSLTPSGTPGRGGKGSKASPKADVTGGKYRKVTSKQAVARLSQGHPAARAPIRPKSASHAVIKRREISSLGATTSRTVQMAKSAAEREADRLYGNVRDVDYGSRVGSEEQDLEMLTPRGHHKQQRPLDQTG